MLTPDYMPPEFGIPAIVTALLVWAWLSIADRRALVRYRKENR